MAKTIYPDAETIHRAANRAKATAVDGRFTDDFINARTYDPYDPPESMKQVKNNTDTVTTMVDQSYFAPAMNDYNDDGGFAPAIGALKEFAKNFTGGDTQTVTEQSYLWAQDPDAPTANESLNTIGKAIQPTLDAAIRSTTLYNNIQYNYDTEDKYIQARRMGTMFGKSPDYFLADREAYVRAAQMLAGYDMDDRVAPDIDRNDPVAFGKYLNEHYPILASADAATFAVALENAKDVKSVQGIGEALSIAKEMFFIQEESMDIARRHFKGEGGDYLTDTEQDRRVWLNHRLQELKDKIPNFFDSMGLNVLTNTAVQLGGMGLDMGVGAAAGAVAGAATFGVTKNMGAAKAVGSSVMKWGSAASMFYRQVGDKYLEYSAMQASNGKPLYTPDEARVAAAIETGIETGIEFWNYDEIMGALSGGGRRAIMDIVKENKGNRDAIMGGLKGVLKGQLKSWIPRMKEEVVEEGLQSAASDAFHNALLALRPSSKERAFTVGEIVGNAGGAMLEAAPSVMGMVAIGDAASNFGSVRKLAGIARLNSELDMEQVSNAFTFSTLNALKEDIKTNNLFKKDPELYKETVKEAVKDSGMEKVYVDTEMLLKEEGGEQLLNDLGKEAGYTADELQNIKDTNADLEVPTEVYCQVALPSNLADKAIDLTTSDPRHNSPARIKETTERIQRTIVELSERDDKQLAGVIDNIVDSHFKADDTEARALASEIVAANPTDVHKEIVRRRKELKAQWDAMIEPEIENIERANKNPSGGMLMPNDDPTILNDYEKQIRVPYRTEQWKKAFGKESLRKWQYVDLAYATLTNDTNMIPFDLPGSAVEWKLYADKLTDEEMANIEVMHAENKKKLDAISDGIELLNRVDDALQDVDMTETEATRGMDKDTYAVYRSTYEVLMQGNKEVQKSARQSAIIFARMCARLAHEMAEQGALEGTPLQVARMLTIDPNAKTAGEGHNVKTDILGATTVDGRLISLLPKADASTFIHESAHWYLITMEKLAKNKKATKQFKADYQRIRSWTKTKGFKIQKEGHEKFARGFEAYLRSGKAPTAALNGVFARFKQWLSKIYSDFKALGGKPSPTVARVFDRMIATDEEIEIQLKEEGINDFVRAGGYKSASANVKKRWKQWATATREEAKAKVMQKVMADIAEKDATDRNEIVKGFTDATREDLAASPLWQAHDAIKAAGGDLSVLQYYNFTPDEYEAAVKEAGGSLDAALATEVEKFKKDLYADRMDPKAIEEMASEAIKKSKYQEMLHELEYQAIAATAIEAVEGPKATERQKTGMKIVRDLVLGSIAERREAARNALAGLPLRQSSNVALWTRKLGQKQNEVYKLMADENWEGAKDAKAEQLMYAAMVTEVGAIKEATLKTVEEVKDNLARIQKGTHRMPVQARYWYEHIAFVLGIKKRDAVEPGEGVKPLAQAFAELLDDGGLDEKPAVDVPQWLIQLSAAQGKVGIDSLTQDEFDKATTLMDSLYKMSARRENLYVVNDGAKLKDVVDELCEHMDVVPELKKTPVDRNTIPDKVVRQVRNAAEFFGNAFGTLVTPATIMQRMDGYADALGHGKTGRATKWLYDSVQKAANKEIVLNAEFARKLDSIFSSYTSGEFSDVRNKRAYKFGERLVTKEELMVLALYCGTEKSYMRILDNEKLSDDEPSVLREVREEADIFARRDRVERELYKALAQLDRKDLETVEKIWDLMGEHFDEESDIMERTTGIPLKKDRTIKVKVTTRDGSQYELKGGYFPIVYDVEQSVAAADMETQDALNSMAPGTKRMGQGKGFTKARADRVTGRPLALTFDTISRKGGEMLHYVAFRETALDVSRIINNKKFAATVKDLMGMQAYKTLQNWAADIWAPPKPDRDPLGMMMRSMRTRTTTAILAYRVSTMLLNFTNIPVAMTYMGAGEFVHAMGDFWQAPRKNLDLVNGMSPFMAERSEHLDANIREAITTTKLEPGPAKMMDTIQKNGFKLIGATDNMFAYPLWLAAYKRVLNEKLQEGVAVEKAQEAAIAEGDRAVIKVIGSGDIKDLSPAQKGGEMAKALTMFYTFQNALYNLMANKYYAAKNAALKKYGRTTKLWWLKKEAIIPMGHYFLLTIMGGAMVDTAIRTAMESAGGSDDDKEGFAKKYAQTVLEATTATVPVVRDLSRAFISMVLDPKAKYKQNVRATSAFDLLNRLVKGVSTGVDWWQGNKQRSDLLRDTGKLTGFLGMPDVLIDGASVALQYFESKESERDVGELIRAIILDRKMPKPKKEPKDPFKAQRQKMRQKIRKNQ